MSRNDNLAEALNDSQLTLPGLGPVQWSWSEEEEEDAVTFTHVTVMPTEVVAALDPQPGRTYVDATVGGGGHTEEILSAGGNVIAVDRDPAALEASQERLEHFGGMVEFIHGTFGDLPRLLEGRRVDGLCADLGVSSPQLDEAARGMSFRHEGPLDMRMDPTSGETALELIDRLDESELADVIYKFGEERRSRRIARSIKRALLSHELATTLDLRRAVVRAVGPVRIGGVDPATRTFQALRIAVNDELGEIERLLEALPAILVPGGVAAIIAFHSLEDRLVKHAFQKDMWEPLWKKPRVATDEEQAANPRSRSAKLRAATLLGESK
jgi:16S rRNA (cytosine1402-N4)-methyltransferase